jgi:ActR/RegA family two-component response regulator
MRIVKNISEAEDIFRRKVKLLIVDDDALLCKSLAGIFVSQLFCISTATSLEDAYKIIGNSPERWHCWIVDVDLGHNRNGLDLLRRFPQFPFSIILSGLRSMSAAAEAMSLGARTVVDKNPEYLDKLYDEVCKTAAIGFVLNGRNTPHLNLFLPLQDAPTISIEEWAEKTNMEMRKLQRLCEPYNITPRYGLSLYKAIYYLLWQIPGAHASDGLNEEFGPLHKQNKMYENSVEYIVRRAKK